MDPITIGGGLVILLGLSLTTLIRNYRRQIKEQDMQMQQIIRIHKTCEEEAKNTQQQYEAAYMPEPCDEEMIRQCRALLDRHCPQGLERKFEELTSLEARKDFMTRLAEQAAEIMQVAPMPVMFAELEMNKNGFYSDSEKRIFINELYVVESPELIVETLFHELKHAVQRRALTDNPWNYSARIRGLWKMCFERYHSGINYEAYATQPIEIDARMFAQQIVQSKTEEK